jgi:hypothetical protein
MGFSEDAVVEQQHEGSWLSPKDENNEEEEMHMSTRRLIALTCSVGGYVYQARRL